MTQANKTRLILKCVIPVVVGVLIVLIPAPAGLTRNAWYFFALFAAVIAGVVTEPIPTAAIGLIGVVLAAVTGLVAATPSGSVSWALAGFSNSTVWLIFGAYMFALGYAKTGLGKRIGLWLIKSIGKRTLGLGYAIAVADLVLAPFTPSNTARSGGTIYPIIRNIPELYGSHPGETSRKIGSYLMYTALAATSVTSGMFLTAMAPNVLTVALMGNLRKLSVQWITWFLGYLPVGIILFVTFPFLIYKLYPPEIKSSPEAPKWASDELKKLGKVTRKEIALLVLVILALALWIGGTQYVDTGMAAVLAVALMVVVGVVSWDDILGYKQAWNILVYFATLVTMADGLARLKFVDWLTASVAPILKGLPLVSAIVLLVLIYFFIHYFFASGTAHVTALFPAFFLVAVTIPGISPTMWGLLLGYTVGLTPLMTPYSSGPSPIFYGSGYIKGRDFWVYGLIFSLIGLGVFLIIGVPWLLWLNF